MANWRTINIKGIYLAGLDVPIAESPEKDAIFQISKLGARDFPTWLVNEQTSLELGFVQSAKGVETVPIPWEAIITGLGDRMPAFGKIDTPTTDSALIPCQ